LKCPPGQYKQSDYSNNICVTQCASDYYINDYCVKIADKGKCFYRKDTSPKKCLLYCPNYGYACHRYKRNHCIYCTQKNSCHINGEYELYYTSGQYPYLAPGSFYQKPGDLYTCYCYLYGIDANNNKKTCYKDEYACYQAGYRFIKGNECLKTCKPYFEVIHEDINKDSYLRKCFTNVLECKSNYYLYYNVDLQICWNNCPDPMYSIEVDSQGMPQQDKTGSTCVSECGQDFPKHKKGIKICKKKCDDNEYFTLDEPNICLDTCTGAYPGVTTIYYGENNECLKECGFNKYILETTNILGQIEKRCVSSCSSYGKFYVNNETKCFDNCLQAGNYHYYNSNHRCLTSCLFNDLSEYFSIQLENNNQIFSCRTTNEDKYYYEEDKIILKSKCELLYSETSLQCLYNCDGGRVLPNNVCASACPLEYPYYNNISTTVNSKTIYINKCVSKCPSYSLIYSRKCIDACPKDYSSTTDKICYPNCNHLQKFNLNIGECVYNCPGNKYYEKTSEYGTPDIYVCRDLCPDAKKFIKDDGDPECVVQCPQKNNYILNNTICVPHCPSNYPYYKLVSSPSASYPIYQCLNFCPIEDGYKYVKYENVYNGIDHKVECLKKCPDTFNFIIEGTLIECLS
jgi:hypothetical protein